MKRLELRVEGEDFKGKRFVVPPEGLRLGRSSMNDIIIRDEQLSRNHSIFEPSGENGVKITDLASANGTFLNERRLGAEAVELKVGDVIRVGSTFITVVSDEPTVVPEFDLGLGTTKLEEKDPTPAGKSGHSGIASHRMNPAGRSGRYRGFLWGIAALVLCVAIFMVLDAPTASDAGGASDGTTQEVATPKRALVEMSYEKVQADSDNIFRYFMSLTQDGTLHVAIDDLSGEGRHINRSASLKDSSRERLLEILSDEGLAALDREYTGPEEEPPKLNSRSLTFFTTVDRQSISIVNTQEPDAFRRVREKLEAFSMNELGIRALQYSREKLIEMAHTAADTGKMKWEDRDVEYGNLFAAIAAYREALADLETVNPKPPEFEEYRAAIEQATKELDVRYKNQRFAAEQATSVGDWEKARQELRTLCEMIPDREDERNHEAATKLLDVEKRLGKKGGRK